MNGKGRRKPIGPVIASVETGSIACELGIEPGCVIVSVNGERLRDIIDYRFLSAEDEVSFVVEGRGGRRSAFRVEKHPDEPLGFGFDAELFDGVKRCANSCPFCFVDGLPKGMRDSLYLKDDDYRLSFLHGNFITMTNMTGDDFDRILEQRLSPLYVSVHSTDQGVRRRLLGSPRAGDIMAQLRLLVEGGIRVHAQIVVTPGVNEGAMLDATVDDLAGLWPGVASAGVVPVGVTRFQRECGVRPLTAGELSGLAGWWRDRWTEFRQRFGYGFLFLADEVFLAAGLDLPGMEAYEDFPQYENGVGIAASFLDELSALRLPRGLRREFSGTIACGALAEPLLSRAAGVLGAVRGLHLSVTPVPNRFFGETVTVSGLLTGDDILRHLGGSGAESAVIVPEKCLRDGVFLDGMTLRDLEAGLGRRVLAAGPGPGDLLKTVVGEAGGR